jgi:hypothetical protein
LPPSLALFIFFHNTPVINEMGVVAPARYTAAKRIIRALNCGKNG